MALPYYDLCEAILRPNLTRQTASDQTEIQQTMASYNLNEPQAKAILAAMKTIGFSLIQGYVRPLPYPIPASFLNSLQASGDG